MDTTTFLNNIEETQNDRIISLGRDRWRFGDDVKDVHWSIFITRFVWWWPEVIPLVVSRFLVLSTSVSSWFIVSFSF